MSEQNDIIEYVPRTQSIRATAAQFLGVPPDKACDLLRNVWQTSKGQPPLTDAEMFVGMSMIARFGLDPIAREIYVTRTSKGLCTIVGIDGWVKVLDRTEGFDGFEQHLEFDDKGELLWVETTIFSTRRSHPTKYRAYAAEYRKVSGFVAGLLPSHMLRIFSLRHAARLFTPIGGSVVTEEEARWMDAYGDVPADKPKLLKNKIAEKAAAMTAEYEPTPQPEPEPARATPDPTGAAETPKPLPGQKTLLPDPVVPVAVPKAEVGAIGEAKAQAATEEHAETLAQWRQAIKAASLETIEEYRTEASRQYADDAMPGSVHAQLMADITNRKLELERAAKRAKRGERS